MRVWTIHPRFLDSKRLNSQWREALGIQRILSVLEVDKDAKVGYKNHPQITKIYESFIKPIEQYDFKKANKFISNFLHRIHDESIIRNYNYDKSLIMFEYDENILPLEVSFQQFKYELALMIYKNPQYCYDAGLSRRNLGQIKFEELDKLPMHNSCFKITNTSNLLAHWEKPIEEVERMLK